MTTKSELACLRFIAGAGRQGVSVSTEQLATGAATPKQRLTLADGRFRLVEARLIAGWLSAGVVRHVDQARLRIFLTAPGKAFLKRAIHEQDSQDGTGDGGTESSFGRQQRVVDERVVLDEDGKPQTVQVNANESPLAWLYSRRNPKGERYLSYERFAAGERLRSDYERSALRQRISANREAALASGKRGASKGGQELSDVAIDARQRVEDAMAFVGPDFDQLLIDVCCHLKAMSVLERERGWPQGSAKVALNFALSSLERHYSAGKR